MKRAAVWTLCALIIGASLIALWPGHDFALQDRNAIGAAFSASHPAGTDELGRNRAVRTSVALLLALAGSALAAALSTGIATGIGMGAAMAPRSFASVLMFISDLFLTLPWLFLLMIFRSGLSLTASPLHSAALAFGLLGLLGWPACARAVYRGARRLLLGDAILAARAAGLTPWQLMKTHVTPHLWTLMLPQFLVCVPAFIVAEANLGTLGLGIPEPLPSWGSLLLALQSSASSAASPWVYLPLVLLVVVLLLLDTLAASPRWRPQS